MPVIIRTMRFTLTSALYTQLLQTLLGLCVLSSSPLSWAESNTQAIESLVAQAEQLQLAEYPSWLRLLHYAEAKPRNSQSSNNRSDIISEDFFLAENGADSPAAELVASLIAFHQPLPADENLHPLCRYRGRYYWLAQRLDFSASNLAKPHCSRLERWAKFEQLQSVSFLFASSRINNPASAFGHVIMRLNNGDAADPYGATAESISFAATVPPAEHPFRFVAKGLVGGYPGRYINKPFAVQTQVYSAAQSRDLWDYELQLNEQQTRLLVYHLWELVGAEFDYYFLKQNCSYRLAELLAMIYEDEFLNDAFPEDEALWYAPVELFAELDRLQQLQRDEQQQGTAPSIIKNIHFIPSLRKRFYQQTAALSKSTHNLLGQLIKLSQQPEVSSETLTAFATKQLANGQVNHAEQQALAATLNAYTAYAQHGRQHENGDADALPFGLLALQQAKLAILTPSAKVVHSQLRLSTALTNNSNKEQSKTRLDEAAHEPQASEQPQPTLSLIRSLDDAESFNSAKRPQRPAEAPHEWSGPSLFSASSYWNDELGAGGRIRYAPFHYDLLDHGPEQQAAFSAFELSLGYQQAKQNHENENEQQETGLYLERFELLKLLRLNTNSSNIAGESRLSWRAQLGVGREHLGCIQCTNAEANIGLGYASALANKFTIYGLLNAGLESRADHLAAWPTLGLLLQGPGWWKAHATASYRLHPDAERNRAQYSVAARFSLSRHHELRLQWQQDEGEEFSLSYYLAW